MLISLSGKLGSGKDTVADYLYEKYRFRKVSIGEHIRRELCRADYLLMTGRILPKEVESFLRLSMENRCKEAWGKPTSEIARTSLQWFGQFKIVNEPDHWLSQIKCEIRDHHSNGFSTVFTDMRSERELEFASKCGVTMRVVRPVRPHNATSAQEYHITETALDNSDSQFNWIVKNDGSILDLYEKIDVIITQELYG